MELPPPPDAEPLEEPTDAARARRAVALIALSLVAIATFGIAYLRPQLAHPTPAAPALNIPSGYQLDAMDFVSPTTGWVVAVFDDGDYLILRTTDAGGRWAPQLSGPTNGHGTFLKFFNSHDGVFALTDTRPLLYRTTDGGATWSPEVLLTEQSTVLSWSFADPANGWMLVVDHPTSRQTADLYRTVDAGQTWADLGSPVTGSDQALAVNFPIPSTGWLTTVSSGPYAYRSDDFGRTWSHVPLALSSTGWPKGASLFVSPQPTGRISVVVSVAAFAPITGRSGVGATIIGFPPLTVRAFDGGVPVTYTYGMAFISIPDLLTSNDLQVEAPNQVQLVSLDGGATWTTVSLPSAPGAIAVLDAWSWWWIGSGKWSKTTDAGKNWTTPRNIAVPQPLPGSLQLLDSRHAWYAAADGSKVMVVSTDDGGTVWKIRPLPTMSSRFTP